MWEGFAPRPKGGRFFLRWNVRIVALSDTHGQHRRIHVPDGDVLIHCGDVDCSPDDFGAWLGDLPHTHILLTWGNHDRFAERAPHETAAVLRHAAQREIHVLVGESTTVDGKTFYGAPYSNPFGRWAFMPTEGEQFNLYRAIPDGADVVFSHGPPLGWGDRITSGEHVGSLALRDRLWHVRPRAVFCGHIHEAHGRYEIDWGPDALRATTLYNVSVLDANYRVRHPCTVVDL